MNALTLYTTLPLVGGNSTNTLGLAGFFKKQGYAVRVIVRQEKGKQMNQPALSALRRLGCELEVLARMPQDLFALFIKTLFQRKKWQGSQFISIGMGYMAPLIACLGGFGQKSFYYINHDPDITPLKRLGPLLRVFDSIIAVSPASLVPIKELTGNATRVVWLPQFSELPFSGMHHERAAAQPLKFGFVGSLLRSKGILELMAMWPNMHTSELHILGDGELRNEVASQSATNAAIHYRGGFAASDRAQVLPAFFEEIDYLLVPSLGHGEGIPTVILEALSCGVPIISTDGGGTIAFGQPPLRADFSQAVTLVPQAGFASALATVPAPTAATKQQARAGYQKWFSDEVLQEKWLGFATAPAG